MESNDPTMMAGFLALAMGLVKILEAVVGWALKKMNGGNGHRSMMVELGPEATRMIRESHEKVAEMHGVVSRTTAEGIPMSYGPRREVYELQKSVEAIGDKLEVLAEQVEVSPKKKN